jgi:CheY-like chemotaxis protein
MLTAKGYVVFETSDPQEALRMAEQQPVHLLLTDVVMPLMKGTELAQRLRARSPEWADKRGWKHDDRDGHPGKGPGKKPGKGHGRGR